MQSCLCTTQVRCEVISLGTVSTRYVLVKQKLVHASRAALSVVRYVYTFWDYLSEFPWQPGTPPSVVGTSTGLLGTFQASNIGERYTEILFGSSSIIPATLIFW